ncbi:Gfo/Idh/MocA family oxidoreductase [Terasakiella sp. SH-1]|uniref:Gfo/Idh/MocA family protein n=1 Tax=Terasakiella sp. SH-1 TaxID=2560057 RepID=UPI001073F16E|nr:Gfo/Idh/MocA family oxidoreductase [Terasakiella sp. SH-1]
MTITNKPALNLGFIGGSLSSAVGYAHWTASQLDQRWQVVSGCFSRNSEECAKTGKSWQISSDRLYTDWRDYITQEKGKLDAVVVLTPTPTHVDIVCALLDAGIPVICEKAMAADIEQSQQIKAALDRSNGFLAVTFNYSGYPMLRVLREHVKSGQFGKLKQVQVEMPSDAFIQAREKMHPQAWRLQDGHVPTILLDLAVHLHHLTGFLTELTPQSVNADFHHDSIFDGIIDDAWLWVKYNQDFRANLWVSKSALGYRNGMRVRLFGDQASAEWVQEEPERLHIFNKDSTRLTYDRGNCLYPDEIRDRFKPGHPGGFIEAFANLYGDIADALKSFNNSGRIDNPYVFGWDHAHEGLELLQASARAHQEERWISMAEKS